MLYRAQTTLNVERISPWVSVISHVAEALNVLRQLPGDNGTLAAGAMVYSAGIPPCRRDPKIALVHTFITFNVTADGLPSSWRHNSAPNSMRWYQQQKSWRLSGRRFSDQQTWAIATFNAQCENPPMKSTNSSIEGLCVAALASAAKSHD